MDAKEHKESKVPAEDMGYQNEETEVTCVAKDSDTISEQTSPSGNEILHHPSVEKGPPVNCKEKIIFFIDISSDMKSESLNQGRPRAQSFMWFVKKTLQMFLVTKTILNTDHEYALALMQDSATVWFHELTNDYKRICEAIADLEAAEQSEDEDNLYDFGQVIAMVKEHCELPEIDDIVLPPPYVIRVIFIYGRSQSGLTISNEQLEELKDLKKSPYFFLDVLYIHELPSLKNKSQEIYDFFCNLDKEEKGYILEVSNSAKILFETVAKLICHPLQRSPQNEAFYDLMPGPPDETATVRSHQFTE